MPKVKINRLDSSIISDYFSLEDYSCVVNIDPCFQQGIFLCLHQNEGLFIYVSFRTALRSGIENSMDLSFKVSVD